MEPAESIIFTGFIYKIISLTTGLITCYLGYRLFCKGIDKSAGDVNISAGNKKLYFQGAAPGTFFVFLGAIVIIATILKGIEHHSNQSTSSYAKPINHNNITPNLPAAPPHKMEKAQ